MIMILLLGSLMTCPRLSSCWLDMSSTGSTRVIGDGALVPDTVKSSLKWRVSRDSRGTFQEVNGDGQSGPGASGVQYIASTITL